MIVAAESLRLAYEATKHWDFRLDHVRIFEARLDAEPKLRVDNREITAAWFVSPGACRNARMNPFVSEYLAAYSCG